MSAAMVVMFVPYCPRGDTCGKKGRRLGSYASEEEARSAIAWHLERSSYHNMDAAEAGEASQLADVDVEEWPEEEADDKGGATKGAEDKGGEKGSGGSGKGWRSQPYKDKGHWDNKGKGKGRLAIADSTSGGSSSSNSGIANLTAMQMRLEQQAARVEQAAKASARFAKQAGLAFEEEAANVRELIDDLRKALQ